MRESGRNFGVAFYDLDARKVTVISSDDTSVVKFMADSRRVMYFAKNGTELVVVDVRLPGPASGNGFALSPDNRTIYYGAMRAESDIWIVERR